MNQKNNVLHNLINELHYSRLVSKTSDICKRYITRNEILYLVDHNNKGLTMSKTFLQCYIKCVCGDNTDNGEI
jgi:hypothetical protein